MATPPRISAIERDAAIARIDRRHARLDDPRRSELGSEPREVIGWVLDQSVAGVPRWVAAADHHDALVLSTWCWWEDRRRERRLLRQCLDLGLSAGELGAALGMRTRQGLRDRLDRLDALLAHGRPDEQLSRATRRAVRDRDAAQYWIDTQRGPVRSTLAALVAQTHRLLATVDGERADADDAERDEVADADESVGEWLDELEHDYAEDALTPATLAVAGLLCAELHGHPRVYTLDPRHRLHAAVAGVERLRSRFAAAVAMSSPVPDAGAAPVRDAAG